MKKFHLLHILLLLFFISHLLSCLPDEKLVDHVTDMCSVCLDVMALNATDKPLIMTRCGHTFHNKCISDWMAIPSHLSCPICRKVITDNPIIEEIMAEKEKVMEQTTSDGSAPETQISSNLEHYLKCNNLQAAVFIAIFEQDIISRNVLCRHLLEGHDLCTMATSDEEVVRMLLNQLSNISQIIINGTPLLRYAASHDRPEITRILLPKPMEMYGQDDSGYTPLMWHTLNDIHGLPAMLAEVMDNVDQVSNSGCTALHYASWMGRADVVKILLGKTHSLYKQDIEGETALIQALTFNHFDVAAMLAEVMDDVDQVDNKGTTALHYACIRGWADVVRILLPKAKLFNKENNRGQTPLQLARSYNHVKVAEFIEAEIISRS